MKAIIAVNNLGFIGIGDKLLWKSTDDLKHFKSLTLNQTLLVGYRTFTGLPPLKNRTLIVDERENIITDVDWCIGGKATYELFAQHFTELHISHINDNTIGDVMMPDLHNLKSDCKIFNYNF